MITKLITHSLTDQTMYFLEGGLFYFSITMTTQLAYTQIVFKILHNAWNLNGYGLNRNRTDGSKFSILTMNTKTINKHNFVEN